jgi:hypothetical protein
MAITAPSDGYDGKGYTQKRAAWVTAGSIGPAPDRAAFRIEQKNRPNTIDICLWYMAHMKSQGFYKVDKSTIDTIQEPAFINKLKGDDKPINHLTESLAGTLLHEVSFLFYLPNRRTIDLPVPKIYCLGNSAVRSWSLYLRGMTDIFWQLTHTNLGGLNIDNPIPSGCYGWVCVGTLHDVHNSDSLNHLGVAMYIWKMGYYVDNDGTVKNI